jgi:hypothetical protein
VPRGLTFERNEQGIDEGASMEVGYGSDDDGIPLKIERRTNHGENDEGNAGDG